MYKTTLIGILLYVLTALPVYADEPWTDFGIHLFMASLDGEARLGSASSDIDVPFDDILENLDFGYMGYIEHRRDRWSFIGDVAYLRLADENSLTTNRGREIEVEAELEQTVLEGFVAYRVLNADLEAGGPGLDIFAGARYTQLAIELDSEASQLGLTTSRSRDGDEAWTDAVLGLRLQFGDRKGWGGTLWADVGSGSDSSSKQFMALASYRADSTWQFYGGYRYLNLDFDKGSGADRFAIDIDYSGPMFGVSYRL